MDWKALGYSELPFKTEPITRDTLDLFVGHQEQMLDVQKILFDHNNLLVIEGKRGVGTTSFANYLRFSKEQDMQYFTTINEIGVEKNWSCESLLSAIIASVTRELELLHYEKVKDKDIFLKAQALTQRVSEMYNSFGISAFSFGASYGKSSNVTQPFILPSTTLIHHLEDLALLSIELGYKQGLLIQLNNLDVNHIHEENQLKYLFNTLRDYFQRKNISWILVGDQGLISFIARKVDRLDDIIDYKVFIDALDEATFLELIHKRLKYYSISDKCIQPFKMEVLKYLYKITKGRLRYIFGIMKLLTKTLYLEHLLGAVSLELAKPAIKKIVSDRLKQHHLTNSEESILKALVQKKCITVTEFAKEMKANRTYYSQVLNKLHELSLIQYTQQGKSKLYFPSIDAQIAYDDAQGHRI